MLAFPLPKTEFLKKSRVRWRWLLRRKNALNRDYKNNDDRNFQFTKFSFIDFFLTDRRSLSAKRPKSASSKSSSCRFSFSAERNANTKATEYVTFGFSTRNVWTSLSVSNTDFLVFSSTWPSGAKGEWRVSSWFAISTHVKKYDIFPRVLLRLFLGPEILV